MKQEMTMLQAVARKNRAFLKSGCKGEYLIVSAGQALAQSDGDRGYAEDALLYAEGRMHEIRQQMPVVYECRIDVSSQYGGELTPEFVAHGIDVIELLRRQREAAMRIAPDCDWAHHPEGTATVAKRESDDEHAALLVYVAYLRPLDLVC